ncbi:MAG: nitrite/sulfite reductase [Chloroflexi bacterium]|nr:MAG: nitrite/sulfite reductase [Chloroflexota bacterium]
MSNQNGRLTWKEALTGQMDPALAEEIDAFETQMELRRQGKIEEKVFAELRLRRGAYGQRYDNGRRHDGRRSREIPFPHPDLLKGPDTKWEAPGMVRVKIPYGGLNARQLETLADLAEEYSDAILHVTTRQDFQLHFVSLDDTPDLQRRLAAVGITTREACGNSVRNVTACPLAGICRHQAFDVTGYADQTARYFLGHRDVQDFGRKFKISFSGCNDQPCALAFIHDVGVVARARQVNGQEQRGFAVYVGGGLGAIPHQAQLLEEFVPVEELLPLIQAIARIFARYGEKKNRNRARLKFLVADWGIDRFREAVRQERRSLPEDPHWTDWLDKIPAYKEAGLPAPVAPNAPHPGEAYERWLSTNVYYQRQEGFAAVTIALPLGDITADQLRRLADVVRRYTRDTIRTTVEQNLLLRWVHTADLPALYRDLEAIHLHQPGAQTIIDVTACPGTDTCKLGIASSRGLAAELRRRLVAKNLQYNEAVRDIRIKISGCFNSCGQHTIADIGFFGSSRNVNGYRVPHFQLLLGGTRDQNAAGFGQALAAIPSRRVPDVVDHLLTLYMENRRQGESFREFITRTGKRAIKETLKPFTTVPDHRTAPDFYRDWADSREFTIGDIGVGECAGEVVSLAEFGIAAAEGLYFEAQLALDEGQIAQAEELARQAMLSAAQALIKIENPDIADTPQAILQEFKTRFYDTELFFDPYAKGKFARYLFDAFKPDRPPVNESLALQRIEEAGLFIEAAHACHARLLENRTAPAKPLPDWLKV